MKLFGRDIPNWAVNIYKYVGLLLFGSGLTTIMTDVGKHVIGRFRPHFMTVCQPIMPDGTNCSHPLNKDRYILDYRCSNANASEYRIRDAAKSFPSGHSSLAMYSMLFAALYIHRRVTWDGPKTLKPILEFTLIAMAWATALSRVSDYKHHCSSIDVTVMHQQSFNCDFRSFRVRRARRVVTWSISLPRHRVWILGLVQEETAAHGRANGKAESVARQYCTAGMRHTESCSNYAINYSRIFNSANLSSTRCWLNSFRARSSTSFLCYLTQKIVFFYSVIVTSLRICKTFTTPCLSSNLQMTLLPESWKL